MTSLFPTSYFGNINYFRTLAKEKNVLIEGKEHFPKQTFENQGCTSEISVVNLGIDTNVFNSFPIIVITTT